jgi:signal transduction histidine kinase
MVRAFVSRLFRTSSFRLAVQSASLSILGAVLVFGIVYRAAQSTVRDALETAVVGEQTDIVSDLSDDHKGIIASLRDEMVAAPGAFFTLSGPRGQFLAGNLRLPPALARGWTGWRTLDRGDGVTLPARVIAIHGRTLRLAGGDTLFVAANASDLYALNQLIAHAFLVVFGIILTLGLAGGLLVARGTFRRMEAITATSREIMQGDLSRRIPEAGRGSEFEQLANSLNAMFDRIQILMENVRQVSNDIAHDLRQPLARLREHLELAGQATREPATQAAIEDAIAQVDTALGIFAAMLRIAEIEAGARRRDFAPLDLSALLAELAETFEAVAETEGLHFAAAIEPGLRMVGDRELLAQMLVNLIENAFRHGSAGGWVELAAATTHPGAFNITVTDRGPGIPAAEHARVLRRFVKLDKSRHSAGSGLGLALVAAVVELHQGRIRLADHRPGLEASLEFAAMG